MGGLNSVTVYCNEIIIDPTERIVKSPRPYDSSSRIERARTARASVVQAAGRLLLRDGYAATTVAAIAGEAGVSAETVYKGFGGKAGLVRAVWQEALAGVGPVPAEERSDLLQVEEDDPRALIRGWATLMAEVAPVVSPVLLLVRAAAVVDSEMSALRADLDRSRLARMTHNAQVLADRGHLRPEVTRKQAGEVMWTYTSPELFEMLVLTRGWSVHRYTRFVEDALVAALL